MSGDMNAFWWECLHNLVAHPLLTLTRNAAWASRFHDWTAQRWEHA